jgi:hypothetical protein
MFLKVVTSVVASGLLYCIWMSTVNFQITAVLTVMKLSQLIESQVQTLSLLIVFFIMIVFDFRFLLRNCFTSSVSLIKALLHCVYNEFSVCPYCVSLLPWFVEKDSVYNTVCKWIGQLQMCGCINMFPLICINENVCCYNGRPLAGLLCTIWCIYDICLIYVNVTLLLVFCHFLMACSSFIIWAVGQVPVWK